RHERDALGDAAGLHDRRDLVGDPDELLLLPGVEQQIVGMYEHRCPVRGAPSSTYVVSGFSPTVMVRLKADTTYLMPYPSDKAGSALRSAGAVTPARNWRK